MIWGYHYFWKHPYIMTHLYNWLVTSCNIISHGWVWEVPLQNGVDMSKKIDSLRLKPHACPTWQLEQPWLRRVNDPCGEKKTPTSPRALPPLRCFPFDLIDFNGLIPSSLENVWVSRLWHFAPLHHCPNYANLKLIHVVSTDGNW